MPEQFASGHYKPETTKLMGDALESAWAIFERRPVNADLSRQMMATAILEAVDAGERSAQELAAAAVRALEAALDSSILRTALTRRPAQREQ